LEHLYQKCYEEKYPEDLTYIRSSLPRIDAQWRFWIGIAVDGVIAVVSLIWLFTFALNWSWKPFPACHGRFLGNGYAGSFAPPRESGSRRESKAASVAGLVSWRLLH
jgi:hypothetical protein